MQSSVPLSSAAKIVSGKLWSISRFLVAIRDAEASYAVLIHPVEHFFTEKARPSLCPSLDCFYSEENPKEFNWIASQVRAYRGPFRLENDLEADQILEHIIRHINA